MVDLVDPSASFNNAFNAAQNVTDTFRRNMAFKALEKTYGPIVGDMKLATDVQAYEQNKLMNPLLVENQELVNTGLEDTNAFNQLQRPQLLEQTRLGNETSQFNLEQGQTKADREAALIKARDMHTTLGGVLGTVETELAGIEDPNERLAIFDRNVRQLAPLIGANPDTLLSSLAQQRAAIAAQGVGAIAPIRQQLDDMLYGGLSAEEKQDLINGQLDADLKRAQIITEGAQAEKYIADAETARVKAEEAKVEQGNKAKTAKRALDDYERNNDALFDNIDLAIKQAAASPLATGVGPSLPGVNLLPAVKNLEATLNSIKAQVGFEKLRQLKDSGATLGQVTEAEHKLLQSTIESIEQTQDYRILIPKLRQLKKYVMESEEKLREAYDEDFAGVEITVDGTGVPTDDSEVILAEDYF